MKKIFLFLLIATTLCFSQYRRDGDGRVIFEQIDTATWADITIDYAHHELHDGNHFFSSINKELDTGDSLIIHVTTPDTTRWAHFLFSIGVEGKTTIEVFEDATITNDTTFNAFNSNRNDTTASILTLEYKLTNVGLDTSGSTVIIPHMTFGTSGVNPTKPGTGGTLGRESEIILKQNTEYIWIITSLADNNNINGFANWYEHINKN